MKTKPSEFEAQLRKVEAELTTLKTMVHQSAVKRHITPDIWAYLEQGEFALSCFAILTLASWKRNKPSDYRED